MTHSTPTRPEPVIVPSADRTSASIPSGEPRAGSPRWMSIWLLVAGVYNLLWGAAVVLLPDLPFRLFEMEPLANPGRAIWQCLGMVIGVFGVGYLAASLDPIRHWPIVLVGLLGKVFGPIGFVWSAATGAISWSFGWTILTNDLLWWIPFGLILVAAWRRASDDDGLPTPPLEDALDLAADQHGETIATRSERTTVLVLAVRHLGCTFCREALVDLAKRLDALDRLGVEPVIVHPATNEEFDAFVRARFNRSHPRLVHVARVSDADGRLTRALGVRRGSPGALLGPHSWWRGAAAFVRGHGIGWPAGDPLRMPGAFVVRGRKLVAAHRHARAGERPDVCTLAAGVAIP